MVSNVTLVFIAKETFSVAVIWNSLPLPFDHPPSVIVFWRTSNPPVFNQDQICSETF